MVAVRRVSEGRQPENSLTNFSLNCLRPLILIVMWYSGYEIF
jgi:hypothetical protein